VNYPPVSVIVIGLNEARRLPETLASIRNSDYPAPIELIYVDSGSKDNSVEVAGQLCDKVFVEAIWPTAARNRNRGLMEGHHEIMHFLDGDIIMDPGYLRTAVEKLLEGEVQCVFGFLEEKSEKGLSKILLHDYGNRKPGVIDSPGAGGTFIKKALIDINGWDERIPRGEESELGERFRKAGYKIWYLDSKMGTHDYGVTSFRGFLKKQMREGYSYGAISLIRSDDPFFVNTKKVLRNNIVFHAGLLVILTVSVFLKTAWLLVLLFILYLLWLFVKYRVIQGIKNPDTIIYFLLSNLTKSVVFFGYILFRVRFKILPLHMQERFNIRFNIKENRP
jgi:glycosyltransferase involved in cell wall biosynthesis